MRELANHPHVAPKTSRLRHGHDLRAPEANRKHNYEDHQEQCDQRRNSNDRDHVAADHDGAVE